MDRCEECILMRRAGVEHCRKCELELQVKSLESQLQIEKDKAAKLVEALNSIIEYCEDGDKCMGNDKTPCRIHEHELARRALKENNGKK